jgi:hypothetical protein
MSTSVGPPSISDYHPPLPAGSETGGAARPRTVTIAAALLAVQAIAGLAGIAVSFAYRDNLLAQKMSVTAIATHLAGRASDFSVFGVGCAVLLAAIFVVLAASMLRGRNPARVAAVALSGLGALCGARLLYGSPASAKEGPSFYEVNSAVDFTLILTLLLHVAIIVLALRPSASAYFGKRRA